MCWYFDFHYPGCYHHALDFCVEPCLRGENSRFTGRRCPDAECSEFEVDQNCPRCIPNGFFIANNPLTAENDPDLPDDFMWHIPAIRAVNPGWRQVDWNPPPRDGPSADPDYDNPPSPRTLPAPLLPIEPRQSSIASQVPEHKLRRKPGKSPLKRAWSAASSESREERNITDHILKRPRLVQEADNNSTMSDSTPPPDIPSRHPARLLRPIVKRRKGPDPNPDSSTTGQEPQARSKVHPRPPRLELSLTTAHRPNAHTIRARSPPSPLPMSPLLLPSPLSPLSLLPSPHTTFAVEQTGHATQARRSGSVAEKARDVLRSLSDPVVKLGKTLRRLSSSVPAKITQQGKKNDTKGRSKAKSSPTSTIIAVTPTRYFQGLLERGDELTERAEVRKVVSKELGRQKGKWDRVLGRSI